MGQEVMKQYTVQLITASDVKNPDDLKGRLGVADIELVDTISTSLRELFEVKRPALKDSFSDKAFDSFLQEEGMDASTYGVWAYYPWLRKAIKIPPKDDLRILRTARNKLLITDEEQQSLFQKTILIAGMSVGSNVLISLLHAGIGGKYIISDFDTLEISNLNRIPMGLPNIGLPKAEVAARTALELDPYLEVVVVNKGITQETITQIFSSHEVDLLIDEVDDVGAKILLREKAKKLHLPVLMATDNSDGAIIDVERYDMDPNTEPFHGKISKDILERVASGQVSREEVGGIIGEYFVGIELVDNRLIRSLSEVKKSIPSWPQLGTAATLSGVLATFTAKIILLGGKLRSERYVCDYDKQFSTEFNTPEYNEARKALVGALKRHDS